MDSQRMGKGKSLLDLSRSGLSRAALAITLALGAGSVGATAMSGPALAGELRVMAALGDETLKLIEEGPRRTLVTINDNTVFEEREASIVKLVNALRLEGRWLVLLRLEGAGDNCAVKYRVLELGTEDAARGAKMSLPFGSCQEATMLNTPDDRLELTMPTGEGDATAAWTYRDGQVVRVR